MRAATDERVEANDGFTVPDGAALVTGAAVASVHIRSAAPAGGALGGFGWALLWITLAGVALTAAGPVVFLLRRYGRRPSGYPRTGDALWALLGLPWLLAAPLQPDALATVLLRWGTATASLVALAVVWRTRLAVPPGPASKPVEGSGASSWTDRLGMGLAIVWPLQCGFALMVSRG